MTIPRRQEKEGVPIPVKEEKTNTYQTNLPYIITKDVITDILCNYNKAEKVVMVTQNNLLHVETFNEGLRVGAKATISRQDTHKTLSYHPPSTPAPTAPNG